MIIEKTLKHGQFIWNDNAKEFTIINLERTDEGIQTASVALNKVYAFAFIRFALRMMQRNWFRRKVGVKHD